MDDAYWELARNKGTCYRDYRGVISSHSLLTTSKDRHKIQLGGHVAKAQRTPQSDAPLSKTYRFLVGSMGE